MEILAAYPQQIEDGILTVIVCFFAKLLKICVFLNVYYIPTNILHTPEPNRICLIFYSRCNFVLIDSLQRLFVIHNFEDFMRPNV